MKQILRGVLLSVVLLFVATAVLLLSDLRSREASSANQSSTTSKIPVALMKHASNTLLDEIERGVLDRLAAGGYKDGDRMSLKRFSAEGDMPTANAIAKQMTDGSYKMAISISTLSLQCVAAANKDGRAIHVFGGVTDPSAAGVGVKKMGTTDKPAWMTGIGTFQPVEQIFRQAKQLYPDLKTVGVVWNPSERNSEICTLKAREACQKLGMKLIEANVDGSKDVREAADSLVSRGAQAFWTGADVTVLNATAALCEVAAKARIPVFSNTSGQVREGSLFDLGANYFEVGERIGAIACNILDGTDPRTIAVTNFMPERVMLNKQVLKKLRDPWRFNDEIASHAALIIGEDGKIEKELVAAAAAAAIPAAKSVKFTAAHPARIGLAYFGPDEGTDSTIKGLMDELRKMGFVEGQNLEVRKVHANGEIGGIPAMIQSLDASDADVIVPFSTPVITASCSLVRRKPVVFTYCSDPIAAGAGKTFEDHLPFITGIGSFPPLEETVAFFQDVFPKLRKLGTLYNNAEANSVKVVSVLREMCKKANIELVEAIANNTSEVAQATQALCARGAEAVYLPGDNTAYQAYDGLSGRLAQAKVPLIIDAPEFMERGALAVVGVGYYEAGVAAADPLVRVLNGEKPANIPLRNVATKKIILNKELARKLGITFSPAVLAMQTDAAPAAAAPAKPKLTKQWRIQQVSYMESVMVEEAMKGFEDGLKESGIATGTDVVMKTLSAQGDMASLGSLYDSASTQGVDMYVVYGTPTLQTALRKVRHTPVLFTVVADPFVIGAGKNDNDHLPQITGVYTQGPYREMAELLRTHFPNIKRVGTLFCPAEANSVANKEMFVREATRCGITVETVAVNSAGELPDSALSLCSRRLDAIVQIIDNVTVAGFTTLGRAAAQARLPLFACQASAVKQGAVFALARDYYDAGRETAHKAVRVMGGESTAAIPFSPPSGVKKLVNMKNAQHVRLVIPEALLRESKQVGE